LKVPGGVRRYLDVLAAEARSSGVTAAVVGGCVRDWTLGRPTKDLDVLRQPCNVIKPIGPKRGA